VSTFITPIILQVTAISAALEAARQVWHSLTPQDAMSRDFTRSMETTRRHALETFDKDLLVVQDLEKRLEVVVRWTSERPEWQAVVIKVGKCRYQRCLDSLEGLIVSRMFKLTKMNMSQTGIFSSFFFFHLRFLTSSIYRLQAPQTYCQSSSSTIPGHPDSSGEIQRGRHRTHPTPCSSKLGRCCGIRIPRGLRSAT
jgi:hypothetical protein